MYPKPHIDVPRIMIGSIPGIQYSAALFNVSALSFGAISANAVRALNEGARRGGFYHNTGEGGVSPYHLEKGGDICWNIGTGYFSCRTKSGHFDPELYKSVVSHPSIKMTEIKLSQGAKPGE
jgi:glutamate synthase domain-containing protein 2